ncbi:HprK-related kinase B [Oceanidesulfovibrio indonesiensis]|nr:HprK-related kinase B [Oceanidesulfovibrio indonesiensis]
MMPLTSAKAFLDAALDGREIAGSLYLDFGGYVTEVRSDSGKLLRNLGDYFRDFRTNGRPNAHTVIHALEAPAPEPAALGAEFTPKEPDPGKTRIKEEYVQLPDGRAVRKRLTGMLFVFGDDVNVAFGPCLENDNQVVNFINNRFIEWTLDHDSLLFHAAGVARGEKGVAFAGFSGMGKSTLALHVMRLHTDFVSNDRLMVKRGPEGDPRTGLVMYGVAKMPRINPGTVLHNPSLTPVMDEEERDRFAAMPENELWTLEHKYDAFIDECFGEGRFRLAAPMSCLVLLNWKRGGGELIVNQVNLARRDDLLPAFMKSPGLFYRPGDSVAPDFSEEAYLELLKNCPVYELSGGVDFERAAEKCIALIEA